MCVMYDRDIMLARECNEILSLNGRSEDERADSARRLNGEKFPCNLHSTLHKIYFLANDAFADDNIEEYMRRSEKKK